METIYRDLEEDIKTIEQYNQSMDSASWRYEEGILITGNQAKAILQHTAQLQADKAELLEALETVLHNSDVPNEIYDQSKSLIQKHKPCEINEGI